MFYWYHKNRLKIPRMAFFCRIFYEIVMASLFHFIIVSKKEVEVIFEIQNYFDFFPAHKYEVKQTCYDYFIENSTKKFILRIFSLFLWYQ